MAKLLPSRDQNRILSTPKSTAHFSRRSHEKPHSVLLIRPGFLNVRRLTTAPTPELGRSPRMTHVCSSRVTHSRNGAKRSDRRNWEEARGAVELAGWCWSG
jgi:hypothetical protein